MILRHWVGLLQLGRNYYLTGQTEPSVNTRQCGTMITASEAYLKFFDQMFTVLPEVVTQTFQCGFSPNSNIVLDVTNKCQSR